MATKTARSRAGAHAKDGDRLAFLGNNSGVLIGAAAAQEPAERGGE